MKRFFVAKAKNGFRKYFIWEKEGFPILDVVNPMDYEIFEISEAEYNRGEGKHNG